MGKTIRSGIFEWDIEKEKANIWKHGIDFYMASRVFADPLLITKLDAVHSIIEERWYAIGKTNERVITVRYAIREGTIRIIGAGYWRKRKK